MLLQAAISHAANVTLYRTLAYDIVPDFAPVTFGILMQNAVNAPTR